MNSITTFVVLLVIGVGALWGVQRWRDAVADAHAAESRAVRILAEWRAERDTLMATLAVRDRVIDSMRTRELGLMRDVATLRERNVTRVARVDTIVRMLPDTIRVPIMAALDSVRVEADHCMDGWRTCRARADSLATSVVALRAVAFDADTALMSAHDAVAAWRRAAQRSWIDRLGVFKPLPIVVGLVIGALVL